MIPRAMRALAVSVSLAMGGCGPSPTTPPPCDESDPGLDIAMLVDIPSPAGGTYGIDATEVTSWQYRRFVEATAGDTSGQPIECSWNATFEPDSSCLGEDRDRWSRCGKLPQVCVDWCDARAYCVWAGKRLCGSHFGGAEPPGASDHLGSQWINACSAGGRNTYVFASEYDATEALRCHGNECVGTMGHQCLFTAEVGSFPECQSDVPDYDGVFDLAGNVAEWVDGCESTTGADDACTLRGGSSSGGAALIACLGRGATSARRRTGPTMGFRCCS